MVCLTGHALHIHDTSKTTSTVMYFLQQDHTYSDKATPPDSVIPFRDHFLSNHHISLHGPQRLVAWFITAIPQSLLSASALVSAFISVKRHLDHGSYYKEKYSLTVQWFSPLSPWCSPSHLYCSSSHPYSPSHLCSLACSPYYN